MNDGLPDTSYLKMIDIWLFFNLLVPFILIIIHTYMEALRYLKKSIEIITIITMTYKNSYKALRNGGGDEGGNGDQ